MRRTLLLTAVLVALAMAGAQAENYQVWLNNEASYHAIVATAACTTNALAMPNLPDQAVWFNLYTVGSSADSAGVTVTYQVSDLKDHWPTTWTNIGSFYGNLVDTMRTASQRFGEQYYPTVSRFIRFKFTGVAANSDSTYVDSLRVCGFHY